MDTMLSVVMSSTMAHFAGRLSPVIEESLSFPIDGIVAEVFARRENKVEAGDVLAT